MRITAVPTLVILLKAGLMALVGPSDVGKSTLLLQLCADVALNDTFLDFPIQATHKKCIYVSTEDDKYTVAQRLQRLTRARCG